MFGIVVDEIVLWAFMEFTYTFILHTKIKVINPLL